MTIHVRAVRCPNCKADPEAPCVGARGKLRKYHHQERWFAAAGPDDRDPLLWRKIQGKYGPRWLAVTGPNSFKAVYKTQCAACGKPLHLGRPSFYAAAGGTVHWHCATRGTDPR